MPEIELIVEGQLAHIVVNVPPQNRFTTTAVAQLDAALVQIEAGDARAVLVRAEGPGFLLRGADRRVDQLLGKAAVRVFRQRHARIQPV